MNKNLLLTILAGALPLVSTVIAEEGGSGHYMPGGTASFIDMLPGTPSLGYVNQFLYYDGNAGAGKPLPILGNVAVNLKAKGTSFGSRRRSSSDQAGGGRQTGGALPLG